MHKQDILKIVYEYSEEKLNQSIFIPGVSPIPVSGAVLFPEDVMEVADALLEFWYTDWRKCAEFKRRLCGVTGKKHCVLVNSGSSASLIAITAVTRKYNIKHVFTTALGFPTTVYPIFQNNLSPHFLDVNSRTLSPQYNLGFRESNKLFVFAHALGFPFDETTVQDFSYPVDALIADCCDALGAKINYFRGEDRTLDAWNHVGLLADAMTLSFFPAHQITSAEGGAILTDEEELAIEMERLINWGRDCTCLPGQTNTCGKRFNQNFPDLPKGWDHKYTFTELGYNLKMTEFQAALGMSQLTHLDTFVELRLKNYTHLLMLTRWNDYFDFIHIPDWSQPSPFGFPIIVKKTSPFSARELIAHLERNRVMTRRFFGGNLTRQPFIKNLSFSNDNLTETDYIMDNGFWLGCWPGLSKAHLDYVLEVFEKFFKEKNLK